MPKGPLEGLKVIDFTWVFVGPQTTKLLADCGAEVVKIESKTKPDLWRTSPPFRDRKVGYNRGLSFNQFNTSKRSVTIDLSRPKGVEIAKRIACWADVLVENFAGGVINKMGLGYDELKKLNPDIIMLSSCMQGQTGPHATSPGFAMQLSALSGFDQISGWPDRDPLDLGIYTDFIAPLFNFVAILAAVDYRRRTGKGQYLDVSQYENCAHFMAPLVLDYALNGRVADRTGNQSNRAVPHGTYRCHGDDQWCAIAVFNDKEWRSFCSVIGKPGLADDSRFASFAARKQNEEQVDRLVEEWAIDHSPQHVMTMLQEAGVAAGVLQTAEDLMEHDPQLEHRRFFRQLQHPEIGEYKGLAPSFILSETPCELGRAPLLGEHNEHVLRDILGMSDEEIAELLIEGILE